jgi:hypothetical protein
MDMWLTWFNQQSRRNATDYAQQQTQLHRQAISQHGDSASNAGTDQGRLPGAMSQTLRYQQG